jgi:hypothetical protein
MSTPKRVTIRFEPEIYQALRVRASASQRALSEIVNELLRWALTQAGAERPAADPGKKTSSASFERLARALKRRRLRRARPPRA